MLRDSLAKERDKLWWNSHRLLVTVPSVVAVDEPLTLHVVLVDPTGMPALGVTRGLRIDAPEPVTGLPSEAVLKGGFCDLAGVRVQGEGIFRFACAFEGLDFAVSSNPVRVTKDPPYRLYWGDLHVHTSHGDCQPDSVKDPGFALDYAAECSHLDFIALTDHVRGLSPQRWERQRQLVREYTEAGRIVAFLAFESSHRTGRGGDNNCYLEGTEGDYFWLDREDMKGTQPDVDLQELWDFMDRQGVDYITVPHHTGRRHKYRSWDRPLDPARDRPRYSPEREPVFEVYSMWGSSEKRHSRFPIWGGNADDPCYLQDALARGCRFGVIASSDDHTSTPGGEVRQRPPLSPSHLSYSHRGLTAVFARERSRPALWDALRSRRCYATTFERVLVDFRCEDIGMGEAAVIEAGSGRMERRAFQVTFSDVSPAGSSCDVFLVRNGEEIQRESVVGADWTLTLEDPEPLEKVVVRDAPFWSNPFVCYYVRVEKRLGETAWTSPIWFDLE